MEMHLSPEIGLLYFLPEVMQVTAKSFESWGKFSDNIAGLTSLNATIYLTTDVSFVHGQDLDPTNGVRSKTWLCLRGD
jgi:hypothetical protein